MKTQLTHADYVLTQNMTHADFLMLEIALTFQEIRLVASRVTMNSRSSSTAGFVFEIRDGELVYSVVEKVKNVAEKLARDMDTTPREVGFGEAIELLNTNNNPVLNAVHEFVTN